ncbi:hypothetical protein SCHPADRAFT_893212 [Schizopora paradoxa]|uniref:Uncharacterized protein n=1 Tax=Schizopora paradoxa TaxID=27342 RepID=A0A0H2RIN1_9AGAM|nr:hypothetical protein SCHPADRAFT_893212 [Schizopora paradoxa]
MKSTSGDLQVRKISRAEILDKEQMDDVEFRLRTSAAAADDDDIQSPDRNVHNRASPKIGVKDDGEDTIDDGKAIEAERQTTGSGGNDEDRRSSVQNLEESDTLSEMA